MAASRGIARARLTPAPSTNSLPVLSISANSRTRPSQITLRGLGQRLGHRQAEIGGTGDQPGIRMAQIELGESRLARGSGEEMILVSDHHIAPVVQGGQPRSLLGRDRAGRRRCTRLQRRIDDGPVARASAQVARERIEHGLPCHRPLRRLVQRVEAHDDARRAEAALRAVLLQHRRLHRVQPTVGGAQVLDRDHLGAVGLAGEQDARVDRLIDDRPVPSPARARPCRRRSHPRRSPPSCRSRHRRAAASRAASSALPHDPAPRRIRAAATSRTVSSRSPCRR